MLVKLFYGCNKGVKKLPAVTAQSMLMSRDSLLHWSFPLTLSVWEWLKYYKHKA